MSRVDPRRREVAPGRPALSGLHGRVRFFGAVAAAAAVVLITACGSSSSSSSSTAAANSTASTTTTAASAGSAAAQKIVQQYSSAPTIGITAKITKAIPSGKTIDFVTCGPSSCLEYPHAMQAAAAKLGWKIKIIVAGVTPSSEQAAMQQTITDHPDGVAYEALANSVISKQLATLKSMKIPVVADSVAEAPGNGLSSPIVVYGPTGQNLQGQIAAAWTVVDNHASGTIGYVNVPAFPIYGSVLAGFKTKLAETCPACHLMVYNMPVTAIGANAATLVLNWVRANPSIKNLVIVQDAITLGLPSALKTAGITDVHILGLDPTEANLPYIASDQEAAALPLGYLENGWEVADAFARVFTKQSTAVDQSAAAMPHLIWTKSNLTSTTTLPAVVPSYQSDFESLWGK
jgi:ABC-type sugar transport system substrate-binding protein